MSAGYQITGMRDPAVRRAFNRMQSDYDSRNLRGLFADRPATAPYGSWYRCEDTTPPPTGHGGEVYWYAGEGFGWVLIHTDVNGVPPHAAATVADTESIDLSLSGQQISGVVLPAGVDHDQLHNWTAAKHVDHSAVSITAGTGLAGGGTIDASRTISLSHLGLQSLADPNANDLVGWDDTDGALKWWALGSGLSYDHATHTLSVSSSLVNHNVVSSTHSDTTGVPARGGMLVRNASSQWAPVAIGAQYGVWTSGDGNDPAWSTTPRVVRLAAGAAVDANHPLTVSPATANAYGIKVGSGSGAGSVFAYAAGLMFVVNNGYFDGADWRPFTAGQPVTVLGLQNLALYYYTDPTGSNPANLAAVLSVTTAGVVTAAADTDTLNTFGRAHVGYMGASDYAGFSHVDLDAITTYALLQSASGDTFVNAATGKKLYLRVNNVDQATVDATGIHSPTNKKHCFGDADNIAAYYDGTYFRIE